MHQNSIFTLTDIFNGKKLFYLKVFVVVFWMELIWRIPIFPMFLWLKPAALDRTKIYVKPMIF